MMVQYIETENNIVKTEIEISQKHVQAYFTLQKKKKREMAIIGP